MSLFLRRTIQRFINDLATASPRGLRDLVKKMNADRSDAISAEWECVLWWAFARCSTVEYERVDRKGDSAIDLTITDEHGGPTFGLEVTAISDLSRHQKNDVQTLTELIKTAYRQSGVKGNLCYDIKGEAKGDYGKAEMRLSLPAVQDQPEVLRRIVEYLKAWDGKPNALTLPLVDLADGFYVTIKPGQYLSGSYPSYTSNYSLDRNPVASALARKHKDQISKIKSKPSLIGVCLCDAGCQLLREKNAVSSISLTQVIDRFLESEENEFIDFVVTIGIKTTLGWPRTQPRYEFVMTPFARRKSYKAVQSIGQTLKHAFESLPTPQNSGENAYALYDRGFGREPARHHAMKTDHSTHVSVPTRWLMSILAGEVSVADAMADYGGENPFKIIFDKGKLPISATVELHEGMDGDSIDFKFGEPDPSVSPFTVPKSKKGR